MTKSDGLYKSVVVDKNDVVSYLTKELEKKDNEVSQLNHKFTDLTASKKEADALHIKERDSLRKKYEEMLDDSRAENTDLRIKNNFLKKLQMHYFCSLFQKLKSNRLKTLQLKKKTQTDI